MFISQKTRYGLRALYDLTASHGRGPKKINEIASSQQIPTRFLEVIMSELRQAGFVDSRRGARGGYRLSRGPEAITVGEILRFLERALSADSRDDACAQGGGIDGDCAFAPLWEQVERALSEIVDTTTLADVHEEHIRRAERYVPNYSI